MLPGWRLRKYPCAASFSPIGKSFGQTSISSHHLISSWPPTATAVEPHCRGRTPSLLQDRALPCAEETLSECLPCLLAKVRNHVSINWSIDPLDHSNGHGIQGESEDEPVIENILDSFLHLRSESPMASRRDSDLSKPSSLENKQE